VLHQYWGVLHTCGSAHALLAQFTQEFPFGFNVSINNGPLTRSGPLTIIGIVDTTAPDILSDPKYGEFALSSVRLTGAGFVNRVVTTPLSLVTFSLFPYQYFSFQRLGEFNVGDTGWVGYTQSGPFMSNLNNLGTLGTLPYSTIGSSTFWNDGLGAHAWTLAGGDTIGANIGSFGPDGTFSITAVPEPSSLLLLCIGAISLCRFCIRKTN
jgi:hypothetical protein